MNAFNRLKVVGSALALSAVLLPVAAPAQTLKFSYAVARDNPVGHSVEYFGQRVSELTNGEISVVGYSDAQLGDEIQSFTSAQGGVIELGIISTAGVAGTVPNFNLFNLPFVFANDAEVDAVLNGQTAQALLDSMSDVGVRGLCLWDYGFRNITNNRHPVTKLEDLADLRIRTIQNRVYLDTFAELGVNATPLPFPETFTALETRAIDGNELGNAVTRSNAFYEVQDYLTETRHFFTAAIVYASGRTWDRLSPEQQQAIEAACDESVVFHRETAVRMDGETIQYLQEQGMEISALADGEIERFRDAVQPVFDRVIGDIDSELADAFLAEIEAVRAAAQ